MPQACGNLVVHLIFSTKQRLPLIKPEIRAEPVRLSWRHNPRNARHGGHHQRLS
jgi:hypothetical protein